MGSGGDQSPIIFNKMKNKSNILSQQVTPFLPETRSSLNIRKPRYTLVDKSDESTFHNPHFQKQIYSFQPLENSKEQFLPSVEECRVILHQNQNLKRQIKRLKRLVVDGKNMKSLEKIKTQANQEEKQQTHLKRIIQKSYFSMRQMQKEISQLNKNLKTTKDSLHKLEHRYRLLELENETLKDRMNESVSLHREQISLCNQRIRRLQYRQEQLVTMMEEDQSDWKKHKQQLKKFYFKRTYI